MTTNVPSPGSRQRSTVRLWRSISALLLTGLLLAPSGCSRVSVHAMADPDANFASFATFDFLPDGGRSERPRNLPPRLRMLADPLYKAHVQEAIEMHLNARGLLRAPRNAQPDLLIGYRTVVKDQAEVVPPVYGVGWRGRSFVARPGHVHWYKEGTLVIDIIDRQGEHLVWRGIGVGAIRDMKPGAALTESIGEILAEFPTE